MHRYSWFLPQPAPIEPRAQAAIGATSTGFMVWGGVGSDWYRDGAAWDDISMSWTIVPPAPFASRLDATILDRGTSVLLLGGRGASGDPPPELGAIYSSRDRHWSVVEWGPMASRDVAFCAIMESSVLFFVSLYDGPSFEPWQLHNDGSLEQLPSCPLSDRWSPHWALVDGFVLVWGGYARRELASFQLSLEAELQPTAGTSPPEPPSPPVSDEREPEDWPAEWLRTDGAAFDLEARRWVPLERSELVAPTGSSLSLGSDVLVTDRDRRWQHARVAVLSGRLAWSDVADISGPGIAAEGGTMTPLPGTLFVWGGVDPSEGRFLVERRARVYDPSSQDRKSVV